MTKLTKKQKAFADNYLESGEPTEAALASYNIGGKGGKKDEKGKRLTASQIGCENLKNLDIQQYLKENAGGAMTRIEELSRNAKNEVVRLNANKDIMDRAGYKPVEQHDLKSGGEKIKNINLLGVDLSKLDYEGLRKIASSEDNANRN